MSMVVQHNMQAANANRMLGITSGAQAKSTEKLSSGYKINRAADDAAGLTISEKMRKQIRGLDKASSNAQDGVSSVQTAEGALTEVHSMLQRMNELAVQASNGTNSKDTDRKAIQDEIDQLNTEIDRVAETTKFNEIYLLKGDDGEKTVNMNAHDAGLKGTLTDNGDGTATVTAKADSKSYTGSQKVSVKKSENVGAPVISNVKVVGNKATVILSGEADGAAGYDYVISTDRDCITNKDYTSISKNQLQTSTTFKYVDQGMYYAYCHAWTRDENGKKVFGEWSNAYPFSVTAITPDAPVITNVKVSGSTIKVTYKAAANATGYDVVLGTSSKKENGETRPYQYGNHKKLNLKEGTVTATFKNVPKGTWVVGMHAFNRTSEDGKKVFSPWSNLKKATVK